MSMERDQAGRSDGAEKLADPTGNFDTPWTIATPLELSQRLSTSGLPKLAQLVRILNQDPARRRQAERLTSDLSLEGLEMLEAELRNQGILPKHIPGVTQRALREASVLRWKARRGGVDEARLTFFVNISRYLTTLGTHLTERDPVTSSEDANLFYLGADSWYSKRLPEHERSAQLAYLEAFASYLIGTFDQTSNRYERGMNLVLKVLNLRATPRREAADGANDEAHAAIPVTLPIETDEFLRLLRPHRAERSSWRTRTSWFRSRS